MRNIRTAFRHVDKPVTKKIITAMITPKLQYAETVRSPHNTKDANELERIQRMVTRTVPEPEGLSIAGRLKERERPTLEQRPERGDLM